MATTRQENIISSLGTKRAMAIWLATLSETRMLFRRMSLQLRYVLTIRKRISLYEALLSIEEYGYFQEGLRSLTLKGKEGAELIQQTLAAFRSEFGQLWFRQGYHCWGLLDRNRETVEGPEELMGLPQSNVLKCFLEVGSLDVPATFRNRTKNQILLQGRWKSCRDPKPPKNWKGVYGTGRIKDGIMQKN